MYRHGHAPAGVRQHLFFLLVIIAAAALVTLVGCNNGSHKLIPPTPTAAGATYVGRETCKTCHPAIDTDYNTQKHAQNFHTAHPPNDLITGLGGKCAACHVTGFGESGGYDPAHPASVVSLRMEGIQCESCHGAGSNHAANPSKTNINRVPIAKSTCYHCHVGSYKQLDNPVAAKTDADLASAKPSAVSGPHHPQALYFEGKGGFGVTDMPGMHAKTVPNQCVTCHLQPNISSTTGKVDHSAETLDVDFSACNTCHIDGEATFEASEADIVAQLIEMGGVDATDATLPDATANGGLLAAYAAANNITDASDPTLQVVKNYKAARYNYLYIIADKSHGAHNISFTRRLLTDARAKLQ